MYGHALAELERAGMPVSDEVLDRATRGMWFLLRDRKRSPGGLVELCHPWESGCDDSPRWDDAVTGGWSKEAWFDRKGALVGSTERSGRGAPIPNPDLALRPPGFPPLGAGKPRELASVTGDRAH